MYHLIIWQFIYKCINSGVDTVLLFVVDSNGSSPGRQGFMMAIDALGNFQGSIGGGIMEQKLVAMVQQELKNKCPNLPALKKQIHNKEVSNSQSGMICSGEQTIAFHHLKQEEKNSVEEIVDCLQNNKKGYINLTNQQLYFSNENDFTEDFYFQNTDEEIFVFKQKLGFKNHLHIIGGGHCSLALSKLFSNLDFYITVYDDRNNLNTIVQNTFCNNTVCIHDFEELTNKIPSSKNAYVVIMTVGYRNDSRALMAIIKNSYKYIGMLGSKAKIKTLFQELELKGIDKVLLDKVYSPIGMSIKSETPFEIAVSIAAQIISIKNN